MIEPCASCCFWDNCKQANRCSANGQPLVAEVSGKRIESLLQIIEGFRRREMLIMVKAAYEAGYRHGYGNGYVDSRDLDGFDREPHDSFDLWLNGADGDPIADD